AIVTAVTVVARALVAVVIGAVGTVGGGPDVVHGLAEEEPPAAAALSVGDPRRQLVEGHDGTPRPSMWRTVTSAAADRSASTSSPKPPGRRTAAPTSIDINWRRSAASNAPNVRRSNATTASNASAV